MFVVIILSSVLLVIFVAMADIIKNAIDSNTPQEIQLCPFCGENVSSTPNHNCTQRKKFFRERRWIAAMKFMSFLKSERGSAYKSMIKNKYGAVDFSILIITFATLFLLAVAFFTCRVDGNNLAYEDEVKDYYRFLQSISHKTFINRYNAVIKFNKQYTSIHIKNKTYRYELENIEIGIPENGPTGSPDPFIDFSDNGLTDSWCDSLVIPRAPLGLTDPGAIYVKHKNIKTITYCIAISIDGLMYRMYKFNGRCWEVF